MVKVGATKQDLIAYLVDLMVVHIDQSLTTDKARFEKLAGFDK